ncbi:MAG: CopG family transcriptional regulator [Haloarculaceae archaeon]
MRRFTLVCDERRARTIERLASEHGLTEAEVLSQLVGLGLEAVRDDRDDLRAPSDR